MTRQSKARLGATILLVLIMGSAVYVPLASKASAATASSGPRLGFWLQDSDVMKYPASTFFNAMFLTPPYPSSVEVMIFAIQQDEGNGYGCSASAHYVGSSISYWGQVAQMADAYPNIRLVFEIAFDPSNGGSGTYGLSCFDTVVQGLSQYPSVYGIGVEGEYTTLSAGMTEAEMQTAMSYVTGAGKLFINYYAPVPIPSGGYDITHTNFPMQGDQVGTLQDYDSQTVGLSSGYYDGFPFPSTFTCPIGPSAVATGALTNEPQGYNQCVVSTELSAAVNFSPASGRQFLELCPGFSSSGSFTGVSGQSTDQLCDNPTLRNWIWTDPNYQPHFVLSTSAAASSGTTSTTSPSTSTSSTATSTSTTSKTSSTTSPSTSSTTTTTTSSTLTSKTTTVSSSSTTSSTSSTSTSSSSTAPSYALATFVTCPAGTSYCGVANPVGSWNYQEGTEVVLSASAYGGYNFSSWSICTSSCLTEPGNPFVLTIEAGTTATAAFVSEAGNSSTTTSQTTTSASVSTSTTSTNSATSTTDSTSTASGQSTSESSASTSTVSTQPVFALSVVGGCPSTGSGSYAGGSTATVEFTGVCGRTAGSGLRVVSWSLDGLNNISVATNATTTISLVMNSPHVIVLYTVAQYPLILDYGAQASLLSVTPPTLPGDHYWYDSGTVVTFVGMVHLTGYTVVGWSVDGGATVPVSGVPSYTPTFVMTTAHTLSALLSPVNASCVQGDCVDGPTYSVTVQTNSSAPSGVWVDGSYYPGPVTFAWQGGTVHSITAVEGGRLGSTKTSFSTWAGISTSNSSTVVVDVDVNCPSLALNCNA